MRKIIILIMAAFIATVLTGCVVTKKDSQNKKELDYTVCDYNEFPDEVKQVLEEKREIPFKTTYSDKENTYIIIGYGKKKLSGYSIIVDKMYESDTNVFIKTIFQGPSEMPTGNEVTYPYIVVKIEYTEKSVIFSE